MPKFPMVEIRNNDDNVYRLYLYDIEFNFKGYKVQ